MKSPFPGMDPYLETHWGDAHERLVVYACDALQPRLPDDLLARIEERVFVESGPERIRRRVPDIRVSEVYPPPQSRPDAFNEGDAAVAEPIVFEWNDLEMSESRIEIRERDGRKVITVIEFLSPANKGGGAGEEKYLEKQSEVLQSAASLVEIDLVRAGRRVLALPSRDIPAGHQGDYLACVSPGWKRNRRELYVMPLRRRLPMLPIPLRRHEAPLTLDLQALLDQAYAAGRYDTLDYNAELDPPLPPEDAAWAAERLRAAGKRRDVRGGAP